MGSAPTRAAVRRTATWSSSAGSCCTASRAQPGGQACTAHQHIKSGVCWCVCECGWVHGLQIAGRAPDMLAALHCMRFACGSCLQRLRMVACSMLTHCCMCRLGCTLPCCSILANRLHQFSWRVCLQQLCTFLYVFHGSMLCCWHMLAAHPPVVLLPSSLLADNCISLPTGRTGPHTTSSKLTSQKAASTTRCSSSWRSCCCRRLGTGGMARRTLLLPVVPPSGTGAAWPPSWFEQWVRMMAAAAPTAGTKGTASSNSSSVRVPVQSLQSPNPTRFLRHGMSRG